MALVETLQESFPPAARVLLFASSADKDIAGMFRVLVPHFAAAHMTRYTSSPRAMPPEQLAALWAAAGGAPAAAWADPADALAGARRDAGPDDLLCVTGSVFLAGELRPRLVDATA
jgi:dihydrofolate synthase/folylpolyglutamate synthase